MVACHRNEQTPFQFYQWAKRLDIPFFHHKTISEDPVINQMDSAAKIHAENLLVVPDLTMALDVLSPKVLNILNNKKAWIDEDVWFLQSSNIPEMINNHFFEENFLHNYTEDEAEIGGLCPEANQTNLPSPLVTYRKGCGKWIDTLKGCPFSNAAGLASKAMTANENRIIELWKKMCSLYSAIA